jgi:hypothetical protein
MQQRAPVWLAVGGVAMFSLSTCKREGDSLPPSHLGNCADPIILDGNTALGSETTAGTQQTLSAADSTCLDAATLGPERVYQVAVPGSGRTLLRVTVSPAETPGPAAFDPVVYLMRDCVAPPVCVAAEDRRGGGSAEVVEHSNTTGLAENLFVVVDGYDYQPQGGAYRLAVELLPP